jgi:hypothetical protein
MAHSLHRSFCGGSNIPVDPAQDSVQQSNFACHIVDQFGAEKQLFCRVRDIVLPRGVWLLAIVCRPSEFSSHEAEGAVTHLHYPELYKRRPEVILSAGSGQRPILRTVMPFLATRNRTHDPRNLSTSDVSPRPARPQFRGFRLEPLNLRTQILVRYEERADRRSLTSAAGLDDGVNVRLQVFLVLWLGCGLLGHAVHSMFHRMDDKARERLRSTLSIALALLPRWVRLTSPRRTETPVLG